MVLDLPLNTALAKLKGLKLDAKKPANYTLTVQTIGYDGSNSTIMYHHRFSQSIALDMPANS